MIDWTEIADGEAWEAFARDFLVSLGLQVVAEPGRGADGGRDLIVSETMKGDVSSSSFIWLVSCKHFANSKKSVTPDDEPSISDRVKQHHANGFMGFYSTLPSNALIERLRGLRADSNLNYHVWDGRAIEGSLLNRNQTNLMIRYVPNAFAKIRPISPLLGTQLELTCEICGLDALQKSIDGGMHSIVVFATDEQDVIQRVVVCCKGDCDRQLEKRYFQRNWVTGWEDVTDMCNPLIYLRRMFAIMNSIRDRPTMYTDNAYEEIKQILTAIAQRTLRPPLPSDEQRYLDIIPLEGL